METAISLLLTAPAEERTFLNEVRGTHQKTKMQDTICLVCTLSDEYTKSPQSTTAPAMAPKAAIVHPVLY